MKIKCNSCGQEEKVDKKLFLKIIGGTVSGFGFWAWVTFLFAGTGFALPIVIAIMAGGAGLMAFSNEISDWLMENYKCPQCGKKEWKTME